MTAFLKISNIETLYFDRIYALHGLSLEIREGEIFAILGPNGAGKTTLLRTIAGLLKDQPKKGVIEFIGRPIQRLSPEKISSLGIVYVPEDRGLFRELTVRENLELGCWGRSDRGIEADMKYVHDLFPILEERRNQQAETLSGGEQQMLAIARAFLRKPKLLMLEAGRMVLKGTAQELMENPDVQELYLGLGGETASPKGWRLYKKRRSW